MRKKGTSGKQASDARDGRSDGGSEEPLSRELKALFHYYAAEDRLPEEWVSLGRRIADAYEKVRKDDGDGHPSGDRSRFN
ncbi:MAG: hypothetical protein GC206_15260 [Alphaproteobacteria bacterium]|nr:hypothetical protein [Alphaproteobacteria bacterium]